MAPVVPPELEAVARRNGQETWLGELPRTIEDFAERWELTLEEPFTGRQGGSWVAPAGVIDGVPAVLKVGMPSREAGAEAAGLRFFAGRGAVRLFRSDEKAFALLEERCEPGEDLWSLPVDTGNQVAAGVLAELWRPAASAPGIEKLVDVAGEWKGWFPRLTGLYPPSLVRLAIEFVEELTASPGAATVLHGDFNPGNVLTSQRGWLSIDCKPLVGEAAFDLVQLVSNRLGGGPDGPRSDVDQVFSPSIPADELARQIAYFASALDLEPRRIVAWAVIKSLAWDFGTATAEVFADLITAW